MEAVTYLSKFTNWFYLIIPVGAGAMITYQAVRKSLACDEGVTQDANAKIRNTLIGSIIGLALPGFITLVKTFYKV